MARGVSLTVTVRHARAAPALLLHCRKLRAIGEYGDGSPLTRAQRIAYTFRAAITSRLRREV